MQDDNARDSWEQMNRLEPYKPAESDLKRALHQVNEALTFQMGQCQYWQRRFNQVNEALNNQEMPPDTIKVEMDALPMAFEALDPMTGTWRVVDKSTYVRCDGHKRAIIVLSES